MDTLFLAWRFTRSDSLLEQSFVPWFPIGRLERRSEGWFRFAYTRGVVAARVQTDFRSLEAFPRINEMYESAELFPLFRNRLINPKRDDYAEYIRRLALSLEEADAFSILAITGGGRQTDNLEVFPKIQASRDGSFSCRFFLQEWWNVSRLSQERLNLLQPGEPLEVSMNSNAPAMGAAIELKTTDNCSTVGWVPRYLTQEMLHEISGGSSNMRARVVQLNQPPFPRTQRVLIDLNGAFHPGYKPMSSDEFRCLDS